MTLHLSISATLMVLVQGGSFGADVLTYAYDNFRSGANATEVLLNPRNVNSVAFGKVFEYRVHGTVVAQPLIATGVWVPRVNANRNLLIVATLSNWVYAFDADMRGSGAAEADAVWSRQLEPPPFWGIVSTPVIDKRANTIYAVAQVNRSPRPPAFILHALDLPTGQEKRGSPVEIEGAVALESGKSVPFEPAWVDPVRGIRDLQGQRPGLALANGQVIIAFGTPGDRGLSHGWVFAYDSGTLRRSGIFCTTCATTAYSMNARFVPSQAIDIDGTRVTLADDVNIANSPGTRYTKPNCAPDDDTNNRNRAGPGGGIWQSGRAPIVDAQGNVYFQTGNKLSCQINTPLHKNQWAGVDALNIYSTWRGIFDTNESLIRLGVANGLTLNGWFRPRNWRTLDYRDLDLGGSGPLMVPGTDTLIVGGKEHVIYAIDSTQLAGNVQRYLAKNKAPSGVCDLTGANNPHVMCDADVAPAGTSAAAFVQPGVVQSFVVGDSLHPDDSDIRHIMTGPVLWSNTEGTFLYIWIEDDVLRRYILRNGQFGHCTALSQKDSRATMASHTCLADSEKSASPQRAKGHPGAALTISANRHEPASGILWAYTNGDGHNSGKVGNSPDEEPTGVLYAYDARTLAKLWSSEQIPVNDRIQRFIHFSPPVVANGRVYVSGGVEGKVIAFGLKNLADHQEHVFYRGTGGAINHIWWDGSFHHDQWTWLAGAPAAAGDPATMVTNGQQHVFFRGLDGAINHIWWDGSPHKDQWTSLAGAPLAAGDPVTMLTNGQQHVFYRGRDGAINHIWWDGSPHKDQWTSLAGAPLAAGDPVTMLTNGQQHVFYRGLDGAINHIWWDGSPHKDQWTSLAGAPLAAGDPVTMLTNGQQHVFYRGLDGAINHIWWDGSPHKDQWTSLAGAPLAAGDPVTMLTNGQQHVFYRGRDGAINHIWWDGSPHKDQWTSLAEAPLAAGDPATMLTNGQQHIFYRGLDGAINHIWWDGSPHNDQWTESAVAEKAAGNPSTMVTR